MAEKAESEIVGYNVTIYGVIEMDVIIVGLLVWQLFLIVILHKMSREIDNLEDSINLCRKMIRKKEHYNNPPRKK